MRWEDAHCKWEGYHSVWLGAWIGQTRSEMSSGTLLCFPLEAGWIKRKQRRHLRRNEG